MTIYISHLSALDFWLDAKHTASIGAPSDFLAPEMSATTLQLVTPNQNLIRAHALDAPPQGMPLEQLARIGIDTTGLHLLVDMDAPRLRRPGIAGHRCSNELPAGSFVSIGDDLCVASPELCFVQLAALLPLCTLIEIGYLFCATHTPGNPLTRKAGKRTPITCVESISAFVDEVPGMHGAKSARAALRYVRDNSRSLMETALSMSLTLPKSLGGHALPLPQLNTEIKVDGSDRLYTQRDHLVADLFWPEYLLDVEYDSDDEHIDEPQRALDANRPVILEKLGIRLITVTRTQMRSMQGFRIVERAIRDAMGKRPRKPEPEADHRRQKLRDKLMWPWHTRYAQWREARKSR